MSVNIDIVAEVFSLTGSHCGKTTLECSSACGGRYQPFLKDLLPHSEADVNGQENKHLGLHKGGQLLLCHFSTSAGHG